MKYCLATLVFAAVAICADSPVAAFPADVKSVPASPVDNVDVTLGAEGRHTEIAFGQVGPVDVRRATTRMRGTGRRLEFFARSRGFVVNRTGAVYDLEGGARVQVATGVSLTGSYRALGYDFLATGSENTDPQLSGGFLGLALEF